MFLFRLISFLFGYVNILVRGESPEKFLNMAAGRGIFLWDIKRVGKNEIFVKTRLGSVRPLRHIGRNTGSRFDFRGRRGLPFIISRLKKRKSVIIGVAVFLLGLFVLSSFIWFIDIEGNKTISTEDILKAAADAGLRVGTVKYRIDGEKVESVIRERFPAVSYVGVSMRGTKVTVEIAEKIIVQKQAQPPASIVAKKAGLVKEVLVLVGNPLVKEGDTVLPGQELISGIIPPPEQENTAPSADEQLLPTPVAPPTYVHARGVVRARVWYEGYGEAPLVDEGVRRTGRVASRVCIKIRGREIIISGEREIGFERFESEREVKKLPGWRNLSIPVEVISEKFYEIENYREKRTRQQALEIARGIARESVGAQMGDEARITEEKTAEVSSRNAENIVRVKVYVETLEDIGVEKPLQP
ncbi:MAG: sporulation protein YqfD [Bacillota bacterium]